MRKRIGCLVLVFLLAIGATAYAEDAVNLVNAEDVVNVEGTLRAEDMAADARVEVETPEEIESVLGFPLAVSEDLEADYAILNGTVGEVCFIYKDVECTLRAAKTQDNISGLFYEEGEPLIEEYPIGEDGTLTVTYNSTDEEGGYGAYTWFVEDVQYSLVLYGETDATIVDTIMDTVLEASEVEITLNEAESESGAELELEAELDPESGAELEPESEAME